MFVLYAFLCSVAFVCISYIYVKTYQLENYRIKKYAKKALKFDFAFGKKTPLVFTNRVKRLFFCSFFVNLVVFLILFGFIQNVWINLASCLILFAFQPFFIIISFLCILPCEKMLHKRFIKKAKQKLAKCSCKIIAITGSFGKTSTKNILYQMLSEEFDVCATPKSFNTPMGICKTILENLKETDDFFIVEFGARRVGDIEQLANLVGVDFGIITPVGGCHLETFGSLENLENTKYELCEKAKELVVFSGKSVSSKKLFDRYPRKKYLVGEEGSFAFANNIQVSTEGSEFDLILGGQKIKCQTGLLGKVNIDNIVQAAAMAHLLGESNFDLKQAIKKLVPTPHRLELVKGFVNVLDDSYNSNIAGFKEALAVLANFDGRKIVVSPGIVELGKTQYETNKEAGEEVAKVADIFVIMNETNKDALAEGASVNPRLQIFFAKSREEQKQILKSILKTNDAVLFENDFPDNLK